MGGERVVEICGGPEEELTGCAWEGVQLQGTGEPQWPTVIRARMNMRTRQAKTLDGLVGEGWVT